jgi:hypothetical protein
MRGKAPVGRCAQVSRQARERQIFTPGRGR